MKVIEIGNTELRIKKTKEGGYLIISKREGEYHYKKYTELKPGLEDLDARIRVAEKINKRLSRIVYLELETDKVVFLYRGYKCSILKLKREKEEYWGFIYVPGSKEADIPKSIISLKENNDLYSNYNEYDCIFNMVLKEVRKLQEESKENYLLD